MEISTRNLKGLPDIVGLRRLLQSLAALDAILMPTWEHRYYSFNAHWGLGEMLGSMRNGEGDEFFALLNSHGAFLKGFVHDSPMAAASVRSDCFYRDLPRQFEECSREPAFVPDNVTFCIWRCAGKPAWSHSKVDFPALGDADGSSSLLSMLDGVPQTYAAWASEYYERDLSLKAIEALYQHQPLTDDLVVTLNPSSSARLLNKEISEIGYPVRQ